MRERERERERERGEGGKCRGCTGKTQGPLLDMVLRISTCSLFERLELLHHMLHIV